MKVHIVLTATVELEPDSESEADLHTAFYSVYGGPEGLMAIEWHNGNVDLAISPLSPPSTSIDGSPESTESAAGNKS